MLCSRICCRMFTDRKALGKLKARHFRRLSSHLLHQGCSLGAQCAEDDCFGFFPVSFLFLMISTSCLNEGNILTKTDLCTHGSVTYALYYC